MSKKLLNEKGFSLAEVMVAAGISGVVALGSMKIAENSQKGMRNLSTKAGKDNHLNFKVANILSDSDVCRDAFDVDDNDVGDRFTLAVGASDEIFNIVIPGAAPVEKLLAKDEAMPGTNGEYIVDTMTMTRTTESACSLRLDLSRAQGGNRLGGKNKRENLYFGCTFDPGTNQLQECSSRGSSEIGKWTYGIGGGGTEYLENGFTNAVLGVYGAGDPPARFTIKEDAAGTNNWNGGPLKDGIALPPNYIIRWGDETANNAGVAINGTGGCISFRNSGSPLDHLTSCQGAAGTTVEQALTVNGVTNANGNLAVTGTSRLDGTVTGSAGGALAVGNGLNVTGATSTDTLTTSGNASVGGNLSVAGTSTLTGALTASGGVNGGLTINNGGLNVASGGATIRDTLTVTDGTNNFINANAGGTEIRGLVTSGASATINSNLYQATGNTAYLQTVYANSYLYYSDRRLKENIEALSDGDLAALMQLAPVSYYWKDKNIGAHREMGLIAQEVEKIYPDLVREAKGGIKTVNYGGLISPLIGAVQELKAENDRLKKENEDIRARLDRIERALANQE